MTSFIFTLFLLLSSTSLGSAGTEIHINILSLLSPIELHVELENKDLASVVLRGGDEQKILLHPGERLVLKKNVDSIRVSIKGTEVPFEMICKSVEISRARMRLTIPGFEQHARRLEAKLHVRSGGEYLSIFAVLPLEQAVEEITAAEMGGRLIPLEALKAQAVCIRSYLIENLAAQPQQGISDTTADLLYRGCDGAFGLDGPLSIEQGKQAARETTGIVIAVGDTIWPAYFHACCGGKTMSASDAFGSFSQNSDYDGDSIVCSYCSGSKDYRWTWKVDSKELSEKVFGAKLMRINLDNTNAMVQISEDSATREYPPDTFRLQVGRVYGWNSLKSNTFKIKHEDGYYVFEGKGMGHNVGLCQAGAIEAARQGKSWNSILEFYFPSCRVIRKEIIYSSSLR